MTEKITLKNGVRIVFEKLTHVRSCAIGIWVESGSRHEPSELCGISHFIEHMLFKGTSKHTAAQLAEEFDAVGGQVNAFTTKESTCYYARTLDEHLLKTTALLYEMFTDSNFAPEDVELERGVIIEEIGMYEDTPEDLVSELLSAEIYGGTALGRPILGTKETLANIDSQKLRDYRAQNYTPKNTVIAISGNFSQQDFKAICGMFEVLPQGKEPKMSDASYTPAVVIKPKELEQNHLLVAFPGIELGSQKRFAMQVLNNVLGAGMSSRLFQKVREQSGLCYTVYSYSTSYFNTGIFGIYVALNKETEARALKLISDEIVLFREKGVTQAELDRTKELLKAGLFLGMESTTSRMTSIARSELVYGCDIPESELVRLLDAVTREDVLALAQEVLDFDRMSFSAVGATAEKQAYLDIFRQ